MKMRLTKPLLKYYGFSLIELAIVLLIMSLLLSGSLIPLSNTIEQARISKTKKDLEDIRLAILGYTASHASGKNYMPCPDCRTNACAPAIPNDGLEDRDAGGVCLLPEAQIGNLPWATLGVGSEDSWGTRYSYAVFSDFANENIPVTLDEPNLSLTDEFEVQDAVGDSLIGPSNGAVAIVFSHGKNRYGGRSVYMPPTAMGIDQPMPPLNTDERLNVDNDTDLLFISRSIAYANQGLVDEYDDILIWFSAPQMRGFLVQAGRLN